MEAVREKVLRGVVEAIRLAQIKLPEDVLRALKESAEREEGMARDILESLVRNAEEARKMGLPICQDTGTPTFFLELGDGFPVRSDLIQLLREAVRRATEEVPLRPNAVNPWTGENSGDNLGRGVPIVKVRLTPGDRLRLTYLAKGGGSENVSALYMMRPGDCARAVKEAVLEAVLRAGPKPCPPVIIGVGVGGGADAALEAAKWATVRPVGSRNEDPKLAELEDMLLDRVNSLGIGPMGLGGRTYALAVHVEWLHRHPASMPVGVSMLCWAARRAVVEFWPDGSYRIECPEVVP